MPPGTLSDSISENLAFQHSSPENSFSQSSIVFTINSFRALEAPTLRAPFISHSATTVNPLPHAHPVLQSPQENSFSTIINCSRGTILSALPKRRLYAQVAASFPLGGGSPPRGLTPAPRVTISPHLKTHNLCTLATPQPNIILQSIFQRQPTDSSCFPHSSQESRIVTLLHQAISSASPNSETWSFSLKTRTSPV